MSSMEITVPMPPSINKYLKAKIMYVGKRQTARMVETTDASRYKARTRRFIKSEIIKQEWEMPPKGTMIDITIDYYFSRKGMDPNNYLKILYDIFTDAKLYIDDDCAKPQTGIVVVDKENPRLEIKITKSKQVGVFKDLNDRERFVNCYEKHNDPKDFKKMMKLLDDGRITPNVYYNSSKNLEMR